MAGSRTSQRIRATLRWGVGTLLVGLVAALTLAGSTGAQVRPEPAATFQAVDHRDPDPVTAPDTVGEGRYAIWVGRQWCATYNLTGTPTWYCVVPLKVTNVSGQAATFYGSRQRGLVGGSWVSPDSSATYAANTGAGVAWLEPIRPGGHLLCTLVFRAQVAQVRLKDSWLSGGVTVPVKTPRR
ncbi:MAG: hypothetical protein ACRDSK_13680 [Actinophytocola sp.]|uniref:hypothetical protein n=1 Tax=Actinophytocola sp. TaxID=1872138 RepID=UPI003D6BE31B